MNVPSDTLRTRSNAGLNVTDTVTADSRDAPAIETGTVYGPLPTRISLGGLRVTRVAVVVAPAAGSAGSGVAAAGGVAGAPAGGVVGAPAAGGAVGVTGVPNGVAGGGVAAGGAGAGVVAGGSTGANTVTPGCGGGGAAGTAVVPGIGDDPGGTCGVTPCAPAGRTGVGVPGGNGCGQGRGSRSLSAPWLPVLPRLPPPAAAARLPRRQR